MKGTQNILDEALFIQAADADRVLSAEAIHYYGVCSRIGSKGVSETDKQFAKVLDRFAKSMYALNKACYNIYGRYFITRKLYSDNDRIELLESVDDMLSKITIRKERKENGEV